MTTRRILLVEDEAVSRELLERGLARAGHTVTTAADGAEAAALLDSEFDFVVTDLLMPNADGLQLLAGFPQVAFMTYQVLALRLLWAGVSACIVKGLLAALTG